MTEEQKSEVDNVMEQLTPEEAYQLQQYLTGGISAPTPEEQHNVHKFLHDVSISDDTTKTGFVSKEELGTPKLPIRTYKELALFSREIADMDYFANYFEKQAEIVTATSLSLKAKLLELAVTSRRFIQTGEQKEPPKKKGFFGRKRGEDSE